MEAVAEEEKRETVSQELLVGLTIEDAICGWGEDQILATPYASA